jgi:hypothetical protein
MFKVEHWEDEDFVVTGKCGIIHEGVLSKSNAKALCDWLNELVPKLQNIQFEEIKSIVKTLLGKRKN